MKNLDHNKALLAKRGFSKEYWDENYSKPMTMDCIGNANAHANYLFSFMKLEFIDISSIVDFGFGHGVLFSKMLKKFLPARAPGIEPSYYIFHKVNEKLQQGKIRPVSSMEVTLENVDLASWCESVSSKLAFDLGICTSVFQYLSLEELEKIIPIIAQKVKYLYLTVPTDIELQKQVEELNFKDRFAIARPREIYLELMRPHFTLVSNKIWESKFYFNEESSLCSDLLYRL